MDAVTLKEFQNRKRYGGMRDSIRPINTPPAHMKTSFKTVNGMEACVTVGDLLLA